jgi:putative transposase
MGKLKRFLLPNFCYFVTSVIKDRQKLLLHEEICALNLKDLEFYRNKYGFLLHGYVIMPDHMHLLLSLKEKGNISKVMRDLKSHTAQMINGLLKRKGTLWQQGFYDHVIRDERDFRTRINYIHRNPLTSGLVKDVQDYRFSSFANYFMEDESLIRIDRLQW